MAIQTTLADYRQRFYDRFDEGQSQYVDTAQANRLINEARAHLHNWIVTSGEWYIWQTYQIAVVANQTDYALPADFFKDLKVFGYYQSPVASTPYYWPLKRIMPQEFRGGPSDNYRYLYSGQPFGYLILGDRLRLTRVPSDTTFNIEIWYAPHFTPLVNDSDQELISVVPGWDEFVVNQAVISAKLKEESVVNDLLGRQAEIKDMIQREMINRDLGQTTRVVDVGDDGGMGYGPAWTGGAW